MKLEQNIVPWFDCQPSGKAQWQTNNALVSLAYISASNPWSLLHVGSQSPIIRLAAHLAQRVTQVLLLV